jgi:hypothetical protein
MVDVLQIDERGSHLSGATLVVVKHLGDDFALHPGDLQQNS